MIDYTPGKPDFNILRLGHIEYLVSDLARARDFYVDGPVRDRVRHRPRLPARHRGPRASQRGADALALPGIGHFSFRVSCEEDLDRLAHSSPAWACPCAGWRPARNAARAALRVQDPFGFQVEYYAHMEQAPWLLQQYHLHRHGCPTRLDHLNVLMPDAQAGFDWYTRELGFYCPNHRLGPARGTRVGQLAVPQGHHPRHRRDDGQGPSVHHAGFADGAHGRDPRLRRAGRAAGYADNIERGPARHGISNALFVYVRDPDGNRFELYTGDYLTVDRDQAPKRWELDNPRRQSLWGPPPPRRWYEESMTVARWPTAARSRCPSQSPAPSPPISTDPPRPQDFRHEPTRHRPAHRPAAAPAVLARHPGRPPAVRLGHTGSDPVTRAFSDDITEQTELAFRNIQSVIEAAGGRHGRRPRPPSS